MNSGRSFPKKPLIITPDDIWSLQTLSNLINSKTEGCYFGAVRPNFPDSESIRPEVGGNIFSASCGAVKKMMSFSLEAFQNNFTL